LRLGVENNQISYKLLNRCVHDGTGLLLSILIGNNLTHFISTSIITYILTKVLGTGHFTEIFATLVTVPILFVFAESIPKNLFFYRSDFLMPYMAPFLYVFHRILKLCGAVRILKFISSFFARLAGSSTTSKTVISSAQRHAVQAILQDTHEEGILSSIQTDIINRLVKVSNVHIKSVMIPIEKVQTADLNSNNAALLNILKEHSFTRFPVIDTNMGDFTGFINIYEALSSSQQFSNLENFIKPIRKIDCETTVTDAINFMQDHKQKILLVTKSFRAGKERPAGIVTMKDLVEELLGELAEW